MYVLCFRMKQMLAVPRLKSQLLLMRIDDILGHSLKPLQVKILFINHWLEYSGNPIPSKLMYSLNQSFRTDLCCSLLLLLVIVSF